MWRLITNIHYIKSCNKTQMQRIKLRLCMIFIFFILHLTKFIKQYTPFISYNQQFEQYMLEQGVLLCCCCCCSQIGAACKRLLGPRKLTKINYLITVLSFIVPVLALTYLLNLIVKWVNLTPNQVIARSSLSILLLFLIILIIISCKNKASMVINEGLFTVKYTAVVALFIVSLFLSNSIFETYSSIARIVSLVYMAMQSIILIDLFYIGGVKLVKRYDEGEEECGGTLVGFSVIFFTAAVLLNVFSYRHFSSDGCGNTLWLNIVVSGFIVTLPIVQLLRLNPENNLLTTSFATLLVAYFAYSGQLSFGEGCKNRLTTLTYVLDVGVNLFLFVLTTYGTISGGLNEDPETERVGSEGEQQQIGIREYSDTNTWVKWHFYMCLASIYLCMVFSNWLSIQNIGEELQGNGFAFCVRAGACIFSGLIYIWTMIAPAVFPSRFELQ